VLETIKQLASRLQALTPGPKPQSTLYNFAFGALYAFARSIELKFVDQYQREKNNNNLSLNRALEVKRLAKVLAEIGRLPTDGPWLAGHYYNSALLRVDVCYEQAVRYYLTKNQVANMNESLITAFRLGFPPDLIVPFWPRVRRQVNSLKHESIIKTEGPAMPPEELLTVIERLLATVEWLFTHGQAPKEPPSVRY
jgi:hypothetical protein